jgi:hypothetical protein
LLAPRAPSVQRGRSTEQERPQRWHTSCSAGTWSGVAKRPLGVRIIQAEGGAWHLFAKWFISGVID